MRHTRGHTGNRRSHHALEAVTVVKDKDTGNSRLPHRIDEATGMYRGKQIAPAREVRVATAKLKGAPTTANSEPTHNHEHAHTVHANAEAKAAQHTKEERSESKSEK